ncbi:MAG: repeat protein [Myxococcaceae bacterium]|nr:repeat protein [Myxococcaceae bacterium]
MRTTTWRGLAALSAASFVLVHAPGARAATEATAPAGGGSAVAARVDLAASLLRYRACPALPCVATGGAELAIALDRASLPDAKDVSVVPIAIGDGKTVLHVRVPAKGKRIAWEAIVAATPAAPGASVLWSGVTGLARGEEGERSGEAIQIVQRDASTSTVLVGNVREDLRICGQETTLLAPRGLDPATLGFRGASMQRLSREQRADALRVVAGIHGGPADPPLARLLVPAGASTELPTGRAAAIADGDPTTAWSEARPGAGGGELVVLRAPAEVPIARLAITIAPAPPTALRAEGAAPKTLFLVTDAKTFAITMPEDAWQHPGFAYDVPLPEPVRASCMTLVLDEAYGRALAKPEVTVAELTAYSEYDAPGASMAAVVAALSGGGARADGASAVLKRAGKPGLDAVLAGYEKLDAAGRARAADVAASAPSCEESGALLVRAMADPDREVSRKGRGKLERCGRSASGAMIDALHGPDMKVRALVAPLLATVAPSVALDPLADVMGQGPPATREQVRSAFARAARSADATKIAALLRDTKRDPSARLELLRASSERLSELAPEALATVGELLVPDAPMRTRYLVVLPLAELAHTGNLEATTRYAALITKDPDPAVRAHAAEASTRIAGARGDVLTALSDRDPRVRESALRAVTEERMSAAAVTVASLLESDPWTFVRTSAAGALGAMGAAPDIDRALAKALGDHSERVRVAVVDGLGAHRAATYAPPLRAIVADVKVHHDVRVSAAHALGQMCDPAALDALTELGAKTASPVATEDELAVGLAAIDALGKIHPPDLARRLARERSKEARPHVRRAAEVAMTAPGICAR